MQSLVDEEKMSKSGVGRWTHKTSRTPPLEVWQARARHREERSRTYKGRGEVRKVAVTPPPPNLWHISQIFVTDNNLWSMCHEKLVVLLGRNSCWFWSALHIVISGLPPLTWRLCSDNKHLVLNQTELNFIGVQKQQRWDNNENMGAVLKSLLLKFNNNFERLKSGCFTISK